MKCSSTPILNPPSCCHLLPRRQATAPHLHIITISSSFTTPPIPALAASTPPPPRRAASSSSTKTLSHRTHANPEERQGLSKALPSPTCSSSSDGYFSTWVAVAAAAVGVAAAVLLLDGKEAMALGPEGPLVEEFWDNMRRYGLYALTVSTGAIYTILQPIVELLKNPLSAVLILVILGGSFYLLSQVLSLMVGINDFAYDYAN